MGKNVYQVITDRIIDLLKAGTVPWQKPWGNYEELPKSLVSGKKYRGVNAFVLSTPEYESPYWLTYKQAKDRGGNVSKGEKGLPCVFWNWMEKENSETGEMEKFPFLKYYTVFNVEQCNNIEYPKVEKPIRNNSTIEACEQVITGMPNPPRIKYGGDKAFYRSIDDLVQVSPRESFENPEYFYSSLYHEICHSTGHPSRLARPGIVKQNKFGSDPYCKEELVAEMGAAFLDGYTGIENKVIDNSAAYIDSWLGKLNEDNRLVVTAGAQAQKAADYILGHSYTD